MWLQQRATNATGHGKTGCIGAGSEKDLKAARFVDEEWLSTSLSDGRRRIRAHESASRYRLRAHLSDRTSRKHWIGMASFRYVRARTISGNGSSSVAAAGSTIARRQTGRRN
jgi:hypothetical protein